METLGRGGATDNLSNEHPTWEVGAVRVQGTAVPNPVASLFGEVNTQLHVVGLSGSGLSADKKATDSERRTSHWSGSICTEEKSLLMALHLFLPMALAKRIRAFPADPIRSQLHQISQTQLFTLDFYTGLLFTAAFRKICILLRRPS